MNRCRFLSWLAMMLLMTGSVSATRTDRWIVDTAEELLEGRGSDVQVTADGTVQRIAGWAAGPDFEEAVVMAAAGAGDGSLIVGTGFPARLYRVRGDQAELLADLEAEQITALLATKNGDVLVATVAPGVLYRWHRDSLEEIGRLGEGGIWDLALFDGEVVAAGGPPASIFKVTERGLVRWVELPDVHARCLEPYGDRLLVGTSGKGLILTIDGSGKLGVLADSPFTEIADLAAGGGVVWAAALVGEPVTTPRQKKSNGDNGEDGEVETEVTVTTDIKLPEINGKTATSEILKLTAEGGLLSVHRFTREVATSIAWDGEGLLVGTGFEGEVWRFVDSGGARVATIDAVQVVGVVDGGAALLTQGPGGVFWRRMEGARAGRFRSKAQQFKQPVRFGEYRVEPVSDDLRIRFRSGVSADPDKTWLTWTEWMPASGGWVGLPAARSLQWEVDFPADAKTAPLVDRVEVAVVEVNLPPRMKMLVVEEPGVVYLSAPPPTGPVIEAVHPDVNGIFTVIDDSAPKKNGSTKGKKYYRAGFRTVSWQVSDPNKDPLQYRLEIEDRNGFNLNVRERIAGTQLGVDTHALPDGTYRFRLTATDAPGNPEGAIEVSRASRWFAVDNTAPKASLRRTGDRWVVTVQDNLSPIVRAEWSRDGSEWTSLAPTDGLLDGREETFEFPAVSGRHMIVVRVVDRQHNRATAGAVEE
ncbi:MAG: hypothetical protein IFJ97_04155 [Acidobacteria bacterium]|uniref:Fibronectin type-III domain-containing protein n=1 Tax=Candidatus Sulfomarinibacter kjeldsenii TaxID=2885994 RepID=A0A8J6Y6M5_9BACT|nr:hypothetical protein [Candidatus Sulfomarinibacter kjeldsenii]MBD3870534.1 hypothetical protein [Candidatus Sulfomarinibacter kjeldsenii]